MEKKKAAAKTEGEGECFAAGPLRASGRIRQYNPGLMSWFLPAGDFSAKPAPQRPWNAQARNGFACGHPHPIQQEAGR